MKAFDHTSDAFISTYGFIETLNVMKYFKFPSFDQMTNEN